MAELGVSKIQSEDKSQIELKCDLCRSDGETVDGVSVCVVCMECLCQTCSEIHSNNAVFKAHATVTKDNLPISFTSQTLHDLRDMIFCATHEVQYEYYCEDHTQFICQLCTRKAHRGCKRIAKIQSSPQSVLNEVQEITNRSMFVMKQQEQFEELKSTEKKKQNQLRTTILSKIQAFIDQSNSGNKKGESEEDIGDAEPSFMPVLVNVEQVFSLQDSNEHLLKAVLYLNDTEKAMIVSKCVQLSLVESPSLNTIIESAIDHKDNMNKLSDQLEILKAITDELVNVTRCDGEDKRFTRIRNLVKETTSVDAEVQTEFNHDTNQEQLPKICVIEPSIAAVREACTCKDAEVQTEDASETISTIKTLGPFKTEYLTSSADVDTEPVVVTGPSSQQSDGSGVVHGIIDPDREDGGCQTPDSTQHSDLALFESRLEYVEDYKVCTETYYTILGIVVLKSKQIALLDSKNSKVRIYDEYFNSHISYILKWRPLDICVVDYDINRVAISFDSRRVETYEVYEDTLCYIRGFDLSLYCRGICSVSRNTIAVLVSNVESVNKSGVFLKTNSEDDMEIQIRDINNGRIISSIDTFEKEVRNPVFIIVDNQNNVIIGEENQVSAFDRDGDRVWFYKSYKGSKLEGILGMDLDPEGNLYVCSYGSNSIHQVSSFNYRRSRVIIPYVPSPLSVAFDPHQRRLIVGCVNSCVYVYKFV